MTSRIYTIEEILENQQKLYQGNVEPWVKFVQTSMVQHPFHNTSHVIWVMTQVYNALEYYQDHGKPFDPLVAFDMLIAALMHDWDHTGGSGPDSENIRRAVIGFVDHSQLEWSSYDVQRAVNVMKLIRATQLPLLQKEWSLEEQILQDADMSYNFAPGNWVERVQCLAQEKGVSVHNMMCGQKAFMEALVFSTEWGKDSFGAEIQQRIQEIATAPSVEE